MTGDLTSDKRKKWQENGEKRKQLERVRQVERGENSG